MLKVALTGNYFSGHDQALQIFKDFGVKVFDADLMARYFINHSPSHIDKIKKNFGDRSYTLGTINTALFRSHDEIESLMDIIEFDILLAYAKFRLKQKDEIYTIFKYSFLFERELETDFDYTINTSRPKYLRERDLKDLTRIPTVIIHNILKGEMPETSKNNSCNFVITNRENSKVTQTHLTTNGIKQQVARIHNALSKKIPQSILGD